MCSLQKIQQLSAAVLVFNVKLLCWEGKHEMRMLYSSCRSGKLGKSTLEFQIERDPEKDGDMQPDEDRSALDMDQTQAEMEKELACSLLQRVIFNTQNDINGLLGVSSSPQSPFHSDAPPCRAEVMRWGLPPVRCVCLC